jgi:hypothetical protein
MSNAEQTVAATKRQQAPEPNIARIAELAARVLSGDILLPKFQRDFVWEKQQILDLLDSIARGFPIGSVLPWRSREQLRSERNIADLAIAPTQQDYPVNYLLDGQQRLSTICGALYWRGKDASSRWNVAFDLREKSFLHLDTLADPPLHQVRLNRLSEPSAFFKHVSSLDNLEANDVATLKANAEELFNRFADYKIATVTLLEMSIEAVAPIFERINSKGTPLTIVDLMRAATWSEDFDLFDAIGSITSELNFKNFGGIDRKAILRSLSAAAGGGFSESSIDNLRKHPPKVLQKAVDDTKRAYLRTADFLSTELHIAGDASLPYLNQAVVLAEIFRQIETPTAAQLKEVGKWFWRTAASGYFGGWNTGNMSADQLATQRFAAGTTQEIESSASTPGTSIWSNQQFRSNAAHSKILVLILSFNRPVDLLTGQKIDVDKALYQGNTKEFHHFFPRNFLTAAKGVSARRANVLANIIMLTAGSNKIITNRAPSDYLKQVEAALGDRMPDALAANLISPKAFKAAVSDDYEAYIAARSETIADRVAELCQWKK